MQSSCLLLLQVFGAFTFACIGIVFSSPSCCVQVNTTTRQYVDPSGRARLFHGVNVVYKSFPYYPLNSSFDPQLSLSKEDISFLSENGFSAVRLYVAWPGVEPTRGNFNTTYLQVLEDFVNKLGDANIYTILDCHQDLLSPKFCGEGAPDFAALYHNRSSKPLPFPLPYPSLTPYQVDPDTGYPYRNECDKEAFFKYYFSDAVGKAWQSLYDNEQQVQDQFVLFWEQVAQHFAGNPYVLGYELLNEPWCGDFYGNFTRLEPHVSDRDNLAPMYRKLHSGIRKFDNDHIIFFEPTIVTTSLPLKTFSSTGLTEGPGGPQYNNRQAFSYHIYCILIDKEGQPGNVQLCDFSDGDVMSIRLSDLQKLGVAGFMTEWGAYVDAVPGSKPYEEGLNLLELADSHLQSWSYWQFKGYKDFTTQSSTGEGLWYQNGTVQEGKLKLLSRTHAQAVAGSLVKQWFDPINSSFVLAFSANTAVKEPTIIFLNEKLYYPNGFTVSINPTGAATYTVGQNQVLISLQSSAKMDETVTVAIEAKAQNLPPQRRK